MTKIKPLYKTLDTLVSIAAVICLLFAIAYGNEFLLQLSVAGIIVYPTISLILKSSKVSVFEICFIVVFSAAVFANFVWGVGFTLLIILALLGIALIVIVVLVKLFTREIPSVFRYITATYREIEKQK